MILTYSLLSALRPLPTLQIVHLLNTKQEVQEEIQQQQIGTHLLEYGLHLNSPILAIVVQRIRNRKLEVLESQKSSLIYNFSLKNTLPRL